MLRRQWDCDGVYVGEAFSALMVRLFLLLLTVVSCSAFASDGPYEQALRHYYRGEYKPALVQLEKVDAHTFPDKWALSAMIYYKQDLLPFALTSLSHYKCSDEELKPYLSYMYGQIYLRMGDPKNVLDQITRFPDSESTAFVPLRMRLQLASYYLYKQNLGAAVAHLDKLDKQLPTLQGSIIYPEMLKMRTEIAMAKRDLNETTKAYGRLVQLYPDYDKGQKLWGQIGKAFAGKIKFYDVMPEAKEQMIFLEKVFAVGNFGQVIHHGQYFVSHFPADERIYKVYEMLGIAHFRFYQYEPAMTALRQAIASAPSNHEAYTARYFLGRAYERTGSYQVAEQILGEIVDEKQSNDYTVQAHYYLCRLFKLFGPAGRYVAKLGAFQEAFGDHALYRRLEWEGKWEELQRSETTAEKLMMLQRLVNDPQLFTKLIRMYQGLGVGFDAKKPELLTQALQQYPLSHYTLEVLRQHAKSDDLPASGNVIPIQKFNRLFEMGLADLALDELGYDQSFSRKFSIEILRTQLAIYLRKGEYARALDGYTRGVPFMNRFVGDIPGSLTELVYPKAFWETVQKYSSAYGVDPYLALAVMREESHFNPLGYSRTSAVGLMQIIPPTGKGIAKALKVPWRGNKMLTEPEVNIRFGIWYLSRLQNQYGGRIHYMLSGYNAGPNITRKWVDRFGTMDVAEFVKQIPYSETQDYVRRVMDTYLIYKVLYQT